MQAPGMQQIDQAFGNIYSMFGTGGSPKSTNVFGSNVTNPNTMSVGNPNNTGMYSQGTSAEGTAGASFMGAGSNLVGTGLGVTQGGLDMSGAGFGETQQAQQTLQPTVDFYTKLMSGDPATVTSALAPTADNIAAIYSGAVNNANMGSPAGGYRAATLAGLPQAEAAQVGNAALALQPAAAQGLAQASQQENAIGGTQAQIGGSVSGTGQQIAGTGTQLTSQGLTAIQDAVANALQKLGFNAQTGALNTFSTISTGLNQLI